MPQHTPLARQVIAGAHVRLRLSERSGQAGRGELGDAWQEWAESAHVTWDWYCTLTFRLPTDPTSAHKAWLWWMRRLERGAHGMTIAQQKKQQRGLPWVRATEPHADGKSYHLHALIGNVAHLDRAQWARLWKDRYGHDSRVDQHKPGPEALSYVVKGAGEEVDQ